MFVVLVTDKNKSPSAGEDPSSVSLDTSTSAANRARDTLSGTPSRGFYTENDALVPSRYYPDCSAYGHSSTVQSSTATVI